MKYRTVIVIFLLISITTISYGQTNLPTLSSIVNAYRSFDYKKVDSLSTIALNHHQDYLPQELLQIHIYLGCAKYSQGNISDAHDEFLAALSINPEYQLDPMSFSPKLIELFQKARNDIENQSVQTEEAHVRYIILKDKRLDAAWRSLLIPGWGQLYKDEQKKGLILMSSALINIIGFSVSYRLCENAHTNYLNARKPDKIEQQYDRYRNYYRLRNGFFILGMATWIYSYLDAQLKPVNKKSSSQIQSGFSLKYNRNTLTLSYSW